jgi:hypothetical protein
MIQAAERAERGEEGLVLLPGVTDIMKSVSKLESYLNFAHGPSQHSWK